METMVKFIIVAVGVLVVVGSFFVGQMVIRAKGNIGRSWVDLAATTFGATSFIVALWAVVGLLRFYQGNWLLDYPLIGEPSIFTFLVPLLLAVSLGLALAKRCADLRLARNI